MGKEFICSDESINRYGFRVLTDGIRLDSFLKNPVGFVNHNTFSSGSDYTGCSILWDNVTVKDGNLVATPRFFDGDETAQTVKAKVEAGFIRAASIGIHILSWSTDPADMLPGQTEPTVTECSLYEISLVDVPANTNCVALFDQGNARIELRCSEDFRQAVLGGLNKNKKQDTMKLKNPLVALSAFLGFQPHEEGKEREVELSEEKLKELDTHLSALSTENTTLKAELETLKSGKSEAELAAEKLASEKVELSGKVIGLETKLSGLETQLTSITDHLKTLKIDVAIPAGQTALNGGNLPVEKTKEELRAEYEAKRKEKGLAK